MPSRLPAWLVLATLLPLAGCATLGDEAAEGSFRVLRVEGAIRVEGPPREGAIAACGAPRFDAAVDFGNRTFQTRRHGGALPLLLVVEDVEVDDPSSSIRCGAWPIFHASEDGHLVWRWRLHGHEVAVDLDARGERVRVNGRLLPPGGNVTVPVAFEWRDERTGHEHAFEGEIVATDAGAWPAGRWVEVDAAADLNGSRGVRA